MNARVKHHWFPFYVNDWETDRHVKLMGPIARCYFLTLLLNQWREGSIPADRASLWALLLQPKDPTLNRYFVPSSEEELELDIDPFDYDAILDQVLRCFIATDDGRLVNSKLDRIRNEQGIKAEENRLASSKTGIAGGVKSSEKKAVTARVNGARGGRPKTNPTKTHAETQGETHENPTQTHQESWVSPDIENKGEKPKQSQSQNQSQTQKQNHSQRKDLNPLVLVEADVKTTGNQKPTPKNFQRNAASSSKSKARV